jgi:hypothetical protein
MENSNYSALAATRDVARGIRIVFEYLGKSADSNIWRLVFGISIRIPVFVADTEFKEDL